MGSRRRTALGVTAGLTDRRGRSGEVGLVRPAGGDPLRQLAVDLDDRALCAVLAPPGLGRPSRRDHAAASLLVSLRPERRRRLELLRASSRALSDASHALPSTTTSTVPSSAAVTSTPRRALRSAGSTWVRRSSATFRKLATSPNRFMTSPNVNSRTRSPAASRRLRASRSRSIFSSEFAWYSRPSRKILMFGSL